MKVDATSLAILEGSTCDGRELRLPPEQLPPKVYRDVNKVLEAAGGKWNRKAKAHVFPSSAAGAIDPIILTGEVTDAKREFDAFYTPPKVAARIGELAKIGAGHLVLEPSAGEGILALVAAQAGAHVVAYDVRDIDCPAWHHERIGFHVKDFMDVEPYPVYDRVVMNPPFSNQQDMAHVLHAFKFLCPGGRLVAIVSPAFQFRSTPIAEEFREMLATYSGSVESLPPGSFKSSGTSVETRIVAVEIP